MTTCPRCGARVVAVYTHDERPIGKRRIEDWYQCVKCIHRESELGDERAVKAIEEADMDHLLEIEAR